MYSLWFFDIYTLLNEAKRLLKGVSVQKTYKVYYSNRYGTVGNTKEKDVDWLSDDITVFKGSLKNCVNYLKTQMIDATIKLLDVDDVTVRVAKNIYPWGMSVEIVVTDDSDNIFKIYESLYSVNY